MRRRSKLFWTIWLSLLIGSLGTYTYKVRAKETPVPPIPPDCAILQLDVPGVDNNPPTRIIWNLDGTWSADWAGVSALAHTRETPQNKLMVAIAKALLVAKADGVLLQSPLTSTPCPSELTLGTIVRRQK